MVEYYADLHIHTVLSPCGDLEMSPGNIVAKALRKGLDIIAITDHNSTKHCQLACELGKQQGLFVIPGAELTTIEEIHCLTFFETLEQANELQQKIENWLPDVKNNEELFGYQVVVDKNENILEHEEKLLISSLNIDINQLEKEVHALDGLFVPAHINKQQNSLLGNLGYLPPDLQVDGIEIYNRTNAEAVSNDIDIERHTLIRDSDAHYIDDVGKFKNIIEIEKRSFREIRKAFLKEDNRKIRMA